MMKRQFKIYSLLLVKNEADIVEYSLRDACRWSDKIIVIDNGSTDGTWEAVCRLAKELPQIVPFEQYLGPFHIGLRTRAFRAFRHELRWGDWWCVRLDADEIYLGDVRAQLAATPFYYGCIKKESTDYVLTAEDIDNGGFTDSFARDRALITHHLPQHRRERRFVRHTPWLMWSQKWRYPHLHGLTSPQPIPVDHYQYRSPQQMAKRFATRQQAKADGCGSFKHERGQSWQDYVMTDAQLSEQHLLSHIVEEASKSEVVMHSGRNTVKLVADKYVVKQFGRPTFFKRIIYSFLRKSKARRSYEYALRLQGMTPEPLLYIEQRSCGLLTDSYYVSRLSALPYTFRTLAHDTHFPNREQHLRAVARFTAQLHEQGIIHRDYSGGNILFDDNDHIELVDLNRISFDQTIGMKRGCKNFCRLLFTDDDCRVVAEEYALARGFDVSKCQELVIKYNRKHHKRL